MFSILLLPTAYLNSQTLMTRLKERGGERQRRGGGMGGRGEREREEGRERGKRGEREGRGEREREEGE